MASFRQKIPNIYGVKTYQETKNSYDWILKALDKGRFPNLKTNAEFQFDISDICVTCKSVEEFCENAYGQDGYDFTALNISVYSNDERIALLIVSYDKSISISTESKAMLEQIVNLLQQTSLDETQMNNPISVTYIEHNGGVIVSGDRNILASDHSSVNVSQETERESKFKQWIKNIMQNLLSNGIWYLLCLLIGILIAQLTSQ